MHVIFSFPTFFFSVSNAGWKCSQEDKASRDSDSLDCKTFVSFERLSCATANFELFINLCCACPLLGALHISRRWHTWLSSVPPDTVFFVKHLFPSLFLTCCPRLLYPKGGKMPPTFDLARYPTVETIRLLASLLERMTAANDQLNRAASARKTNARRASSASLLASSSNKPTADPPTDNYTRFRARTIPSIDIYSYLSRIFKYCPCANECFLSLLVYFDRMSKNALAQNGRPLTIDSYNIHRLIIAGVMVSSKFFSDVFYTNTRYAKVNPRRKDDVHHSFHRWLTCLRCVRWAGFR